MKIIRFYVMEDVPSTLKEILEVLNETQGCEVLGYSDTVQTGFEDIISLQPDALLLDITLNGGTAFELIQLLKDNKIPIPPVIIMTGTPEFDFARKSVDLLGSSLVTLLDKPFWKTWPQDFPAIKATVIARMSLNKQEDPDLMLWKRNSQEELFVRSSHMTYRIVMNEVLYISTRRGDSMFKLRSGKTVKVSKTLNDLMSKVPSYICRISRDQSVNLRWLDQIDHETSELFLEGCKENFLIGDAYKANLKAIIGI